MFLVREECRRRRILDVRAAELQEEMAEQRSSVPPDPTKTAATQRTSQRAERAIKRSAMREQLTSKTGLAYDGGRCGTSTMDEVWRGAERHKGTSRRHRPCR